jgi:hypothetical protein
VHVLVSDATVESRMSRGSRLVRGSSERGYSTRLLSLLPLQIHPSSSSDSYHGSLECLASHRKANTSTSMVSVDLLCLIDSILL